MTKQVLTLEERVQVLEHQVKALAWGQPQDDESFVRRVAQHLYWQLAEVERLQPDGLSELVKTELTHHADVLAGIDGVDDSLKPNLRLAIREDLDLG